MKSRLCEARADASPVQFREHYSVCIQSTLVSSRRFHAVRRSLTAALFLGTVLFAFPSELRSQEDIRLQGRWQIRMPSRPAYNGLALIDAEYRSTWDDGYGPQLHGYVAHIDSVEAELIFTDGVGVILALCTIQSSDLLHCEHRYRDGGVSNSFVDTDRGRAKDPLAGSPVTFTLGFLCSRRLGHHA
jgi:hypothetical protein